MKKRLKKVNNSFLLFFFLLSPFFLFSLFAQKPQNEFSIYVGGGYEAFIIQKPTSKSSSKGYGIDAGVGFTVFFDRNWGLHTGVGFGLFNVNNEVDKFYFITPEQEDCERYLYNLHTTLNNYSENHKTLFITLPIMVLYQTKMAPLSYKSKSAKAGFYAMVGAKTLFHIKNNYTTKVASIFNAAYYPEFDNWINELPILWLGKFSGSGTNGKMKFNVLPMFAFETGFKWQIGKNLYLYTGVYFDCGLYDYTKKSRTSYTDYTAPEHLSELKLIDFAKRMNLMAVGVKLRLAFCKSKPKTCCR